MSCAELVVLLQKFILITKYLYDYKIRQSVFTIFNVRNKKQYFPAMIFKKGKDELSRRFISLQEKLKIEWYINISLPGI